MINVADIESAHQKDIEINQENPSHEVMYTVNGFNTLQLVSQMLRHSDELLQSIQHEVKELPGTAAEAITMEETVENHNLLTVEQRELLRVQSDTFQYLNLDIDTLSGKLNVIAREKNWLEEYLKFSVLLETITDEQKAYCQNAVNQATEFINQNGTASVMDSSVMEDKIIYGEYSKSRHRVDLE